MNCKPGDLAYYCKIDSPNYGTILRVIRLSEWGGLMRPDGTIHEGVVWETDTPLPVQDPAKPPHQLMLDCFLRPIRDPGDDAVDESHAWLPPVPLPAIDPSLLPEKVGA